MYNSHMFINFALQVINIRFQQYNTSSFGDFLDNCGFGACGLGACGFNTCGFGACGWEGISYEIGCLFQSTDSNTLVFRLSSIYYYRTS